MKRFFSKRSSQRSQLQYFNTTLDTQIEYDSQRDNSNIIKLKTPIIGVPIIVQIFIEYFDRDDILKTEGLFRTTGSIKQVKLLKDDIETSGLINLYKDENDLLTLTSLFKLWLRELQDGVIPNEDYIKMEAAQDSLELFKIALDTLSRYHWETLRYISQFLLKLSSFSEENKMNVNNICIVFGPTLIKSDMDSLDSQVVLNDNIKNSQILELILTNFDYLFDTDSLSNLNSPTQMNLKQSFDSLSSISNDVVLNEMENLQVDNVVKKTVQSFFGSNRKKSMMMDNDGLTMNGKLKPRNRSDSNLLDNTKDKNSKLQKTRNRSTTNLLDTKESNSNDKIFQTRNRSTTNLKVELKQSTDYHPNDKIQSKEQKSKVESVFVPLKGDEETIRKIPLKGEQDSKRSLIPTPLALASSNLDSPSTSLPSNVQSPIKTGMSVVRATPSSTSATPLVKPNRPAPSRPTVLDTIFQSPLVEDVPPLKDVDTLENHDSMTKVVDIDIMNSSSKPKQIDSTTNDKIAPTPSRSTLNPPKRPPPAIPNVNSPIIPIKGFHGVEDVKEKMGKAVDEDTAVDKVSDEMVEELGNTPVVDKKPLLGYQTVNSKAKIPSHNEMQKFEKSNQDISVSIVEKTLPSPQKNLSFTHGKLLTPPKRAPPPVPAAISPLLFNTVPQCLPTVLISHPIPSIKVDPDTQVDPPTSRSISKESEMNHRKYPFIHNPLIVTRLRPLDKDSCASIVSEITSGSHSSSSLPSANTSQSNLLLNAPLGTSLSNVLSPTNVLNSSNSYSSPALNTTGLSSPTNSHFSLTTITPTLLIDSPNEGRYQRRRKEDAKKAKRRDLKCDELKVRNLLNQKAVDELTHQDIQDIKDLFKSLQVMVKDGENEEGLMFYKQLKRVIRGWQISDGLEKGMKSVDDLVVEGNEMRMMLREDEDLDTDQSLNDNGLKRVGEHVTVSDNVQHTVHVPTSKKVEIAKDNRDDSVYTIEDAKANEGMNGTMESKQFELETIKQEKSRLKRKLATLKEQYTIRNKNGDMVTAKEKNEMKIDYKKYCDLKSKEIELMQQVSEIEIQPNEYNEMKKRKRQLQEQLHKHQTQFAKEHGRPVTTKSDLEPYRKEYQEYKNLKKLLDGYEKE